LQESWDRNYDGYLRFWVGVMVMPRFIKDELLYKVRPGTNHADNEWLRIDHVGLRPIRIESHHHKPMRCSHI
jgi:hypothetical protein